MVQIYSPTTLSRLRRHAAWPRLWRAERMDVSIGTGRGMKDKRDRFEAEGRPRDLVVFSLVRESKCSECNKELCRGDVLFKDGERGLCLTCADLDELVYLPSGDAALTRRAR